MLKTRNCLVDSMRGIAILLVFLGHSIISKPVDISLEFKWLTNIIHATHMHVFFFISGYCYKPTKNDLGGYFAKDLKDYLFHTLYSL